MAFRLFFLLVVVACVVVSATARKEAPGLKASTGKSLLQHAEGQPAQHSGNPSGQPSYGVNNLYGVPEYNPFAVQVYQPQLQGQPQGFNPYGPQYQAYPELVTPHGPQPQGPYEPFNPFGPHPQPEPYKPATDPYVPLKPAYGAGHAGGYGCPDGYIVAYGPSGAECVPMPHHEPKNSHYPPRDYLSIERCPVGQLYRYMADGRTACLPESYVYEGTIAAAAAPVPSPPAEE